MDDVLAYFRKIAPEFESIEDDVITDYIDLYKDIVSETYFGKLYTRALAFFVAHQIKLSNVISDSEYGSTDSSIVAGNLVSEKEGDLEKQYGSSTSTDETNELLNKTYYGKTYLYLLSLKRPLGIMRIKR